MNISKYLSMLVPVALAFGAAACSDDENTYTPADPVREDCQRVYFSAENETSYTFPTTDDLSEMTMTLKVRRELSDAAASVPVTATREDTATGADGGEIRIFDYPSTIDFAAGEEEADFTITLLDKSAGEYALYLAIEGDEFVDPYTTLGLSMISISVDLEQWDLYEATNESELFGKTFDLTILHKGGSNEYTFSNIWDFDPGFTVTSGKGLSVTFDETCPNFYFYSGYTQEDGFYYYGSKWKWSYWVYGYWADYPEYGSTFDAEKREFIFVVEDDDWNCFYEYITW